jgi:DNA-binding MarR family transcriptional regulator
MRPAVGLKMHTIAFSLHRADQRMLAFQRALLAPFGITPARYLMLLVILRVGIPIGNEPCLRQSDLRRELGVSRVTVSIMVRALEKLGLVRRCHRVAGDRRQIDVILTAHGSALLGRIERKVIRPGIVWMAMYSMFRMDAGRLGGLHYRLDEVRRAFLDSAQFYYAWCERTLFPERRWKTPAPFQWPKTKAA